MRLWSIHPKYLDSKGLVALWREGLLAKAVLEGKTRGYLHHPQLVRFREHPDPLGAIQAYLWAVLEEATRRGYKFDPGKVCWREKEVEWQHKSVNGPPHKLKGPQEMEGNVHVIPIPLTSGQLAYEWNHLLQKLKTRDPVRYQRLKHLSTIDPHPLMKLVPGPRAPWEIVH